MAVACLFIAVGCMARVEAEEPTRLIPQSYKACRQAGSLAREVSALRCIYVLEPEPTERFTACLLRVEAYHEWVNQSCRTVRDPRGWHSLICGSTSVGVFSGPCQLVYYNPAYQFPDGFATCKARGGKIDQTYTGEALCTVEVDLAPYEAPNKTVYNLDIGQRIMGTCRNRGGHYELALDKHPECRLRFLDATTPRACEAAQARWVEHDGVRFCTIDE